MLKKTFSEMFLPTFFLDYIKWFDHLRRLKTAITGGYASFFTQKDREREREEGGRQYLHISAYFGTWWVDVNNIFLEDWEAGYKLIIGQQ